jgi:queuine tRNA-ribosyltransferase
VKNFSFEIVAKVGELARAGIIHTPHGDVLTPTFCAVATHGAVKFLPMKNLHEIGAQMMLANGYHLLRRAALIDAAGGLAKWNGWNAPTVTDSGGFQVMSLGSGLGKIVSMAAENSLADSGSGQNLAAKLSQSAGKNLANTAQNFQENSASQTAQTSQTKNGKAENSEKSLSHRADQTENFVAAKSQRLAAVDDEGVTFRDPYNGRIVKFTPELSIRTQHQLGADVMMAFDELTNFADSREYNVESLERTRRWAERSLREHLRQTNLRADKNYQALYGVLQGGRWRDLREKAARDLAEMRIDGQGFDGFGLGGAFEKENLGETLAWMTRILPENKPRHLLGLSHPDDIFTGVANGADTFDCVAPTREARHGRILASTGIFSLKRAEFAGDPRALDADCDCPTCLSGWTRGDLRALLKSPERERRAEAFTLLSQHNLRFTIRLFEQIRVAIIDGDFDEFRAGWLRRFYG